MRNTISTLVMIVVLSVTTGYCQQLAMSLQAESTAAGMQAGATAMFETKKLWGLGGFYQRSTSTSVNREDTDSFYGAQFQAPLVKSQRITFSAVLRGGFVNKMFFVVVPGVETQINFNKRFGIGIGASMRMNYPSISTRIIIKIF